MSEPRFLVAPLSTEDLTVTQAMSLLARWMVQSPGEGAPSITISKRDSDRRTVRCSCGHTRNRHRNDIGCLAPVRKNVPCVCTSFRAAD